MDAVRKRKKVLNPWPNISLVPYPKEEKKKQEEQSYSIYAEITILIFSTVALAFTSVYLLAAIHAPSEKLQLSETFIKLVIILSTLTTVDHVVAIIRS